MKKFFNFNNLLSNIPKPRAQNEVWANPLRDWTIMLLVFSILFLSAFAYAMYRFYVWQNLEDYLPVSEDEHVRYNKSEAEAVAEEFSSRSLDTSQFSVTIPTATTSQEVEN